ncbi:MAG: C-GCAxxG-C-C family protein [Lachnospiraceae bacterium]|nr:C-GCAxxG-C-C family protein [Lachnospiraceae bacterium]
MKKMERSEVAKHFMAGTKNCAQCTLAAFADDMGYDVEETDKLLTNFGGGVQFGEVCGAVVGANIAIGMLVDGPEAHAKGEEFCEKFIERFGSLRCKELTGYDVSIAEEFEKWKESGVGVDKCPDFVIGAYEILEEIL